MQLTPSTLPSDSNLFSLLVPAGAIAPAGSPAPAAVTGTVETFDTLFPDLVSGAPCEPAAATGPAETNGGVSSSPLMGALRAGRCVVSDGLPETLPQLSSEPRATECQPADGELTPDAPVASMGTPQQARAWTKSARLPARSERVRAGNEEVQLSGVRPVAFTGAEIPATPPPAADASQPDCAVPPVDPAAWASPGFCASEVVSSSENIQGVDTPVPESAGSEASVGRGTVGDAVPTEVRGSGSRTTKGSSKVFPATEWRAGASGMTSPSEESPRTPKVLRQLPGLSSMPAEAYSAVGSAELGTETSAVPTIVPADAHVFEVPTERLAAHRPGQDADVALRLSPPLGRGVYRRVPIQAPDVAAPVATEGAVVRPGASSPTGTSLPLAMKPAWDVPTLVVPGLTRVSTGPGDAEAAEPGIILSESGRLQEGVVAETGGRGVPGFDFTSDSEHFVTAERPLNGELAASAPSAQGGVSSVMPRPRNGFWPMVAMPESVPADGVRSDPLVRIAMVSPSNSSARSAVSEQQSVEPFMMAEMPGAVVAAPGTAPLEKARVGLSTMRREVALPWSESTSESSGRAVPAAEVGEQDVTGDVPVGPRLEPEAGRFGLEVPVTEVEAQDATGEIPVGRFPAAAPLDAAISAARPRGNPAAKLDVGSGRVKNFLNSGSERLVEGDVTLGTDVAKRSATMPSRFFPTDGANLKSEYVPAMPVDSTGTSQAAAPVAAAKLESAPVVFASPVSARGAVEAVLQVTEAAQSREQKSVSLQFSVGQENLGVRVELIRGEVRATFHTESAELHAALAHEWQGAASGTWGADRGVKLSPAVFAAIDGNAQNAFSGDAAPRERSPHSRRERAESRLARSISPVSGASLHAEPMVPAIAARLGFTGNSLHLHTLA